MARIDIDSVTKVFDDDGEEVVAVDDVDLHIEDGEFVVLVGPSGSGKSTLLRIVAGLVRQTSGNVRIDGEVVNQQEPRERDIAMVFQNYALYPNMTVRENMSFGLKMSTDLDADEIDRRVEDAAETMGIGELLDRSPGDLSGGQQQRVALGRAIVRDPTAFLMDEPLSNLDAKLRTEMRTEINRLQNELDVTTIYVTHDQTEAMTMSDRLVVLNMGEIQQVGTPQECFYRPANRFVAGFLGSPSMNFIQAELNGNVLEAEGFSYSIDEGVTSSTDVSRVTLGIRPEDVELYDERRTDDDVECYVDVVEPMGSVKYVYLQFTGAEAGETYVVETDGQRPIDEGDTIYAHLPEDVVYLFDGETGETIYQRTVSETAKQDFSKTERQDVEAAPE